MKKKFIFTIELLADIPDKITPKFVEKIIAEVDKKKYLSGYMPQTDKHQAFIDYIQNNQNIHEQIISGDLFSDYYYAFRASGGEERIARLHPPKGLIDIIREKSLELDNETSDFILNIYMDNEDDESDDKIDIDGNPLPVRSKKEVLDDLKRNIDNQIIWQSLFNYVITSTSCALVAKD